MLTCVAALLLLRIQPFMNRDPRAFAPALLLGLALVLAGGYFAFTTGDAPTANDVAEPPNATETPASEPTPTEGNTPDATPTGQGTTDETAAGTQRPETEFDPQVAEALALLMDRVEPATA